MTTADRDGDAAPSNERRAALRRTAAIGAGSLAAVTAGACVSARPTGGGTGRSGDGTVTAASLVGKTVRIYNSGEPLTRDLRQDRANIELGPGGRIVSIWIG